MLNFYVEFTAALFLSRYGVLLPLSDWARLRSYEILAALHCSFEWHVKMYIAGYQAVAVVVIAISSSRTFLAGFFLREPFSSVHVAGLPISAAFSVRAARESLPITFCCSPQEFCFSRLYQERPHGHSDDPPPPQSR